MTGGGGFIAGSIIANLLMDKTGWNQSIAQVVGPDAAKLKDSAQQIGQKFKDVGQQMISAGTGIGIFGAALTGAIVTGVKAFATFDAAMTESLAIMGNVSDAMRRDLVDAARQVARQTTFSAAEAAKAYYFLASAGYSAAEAVKLLPIAAKFAQAGMFGLEQATSLLADAQSALGLRIRDDAVANMQNMARVADVLSRANIMANASIEQFSESLTTRAGAALRLVGKDIEEGAAVLAAFADQGVKGAEAGTRLDIVLRDLQTRAIENKAVFEKYSVAVFDSSGEMRNMADIIGDLEKALAGKSDEMKRSILMEMQFADRSVASILNLVGMSDAIRKYEAELRKAGGTTEEIANKQLATLNSQLKLAQNAVSGMAAAFGETLVPILTKVVTKAREAAEEIAALARKYPELAGAVSFAAGGLGLFLGIVGGVIVGLGTLARSIGAIIQFMPGLAAWFSRLIPLVSQFALIAASAFAGWNFGRWIGEVTGLDEVYQRLFDTVFRFLGIIKETNIELGSRHAETYALQTEAIARATQLAGKEVKNFIEAKHVLEEAFRKAGTTGNKVLDDWLKKFPPVTKKASDLGVAVFDLSAALTEFGLKTKTQLSNELKIAEKALEELRKSASESTPAAIKGLTEKIAELRDQLKGTVTDTRSLKEQFDITFRSETEAQVKRMGDALLLYRGKMTAEQVDKLRAEIDNLAGSLKLNLVPAADEVAKHVDQALEKLVDMALKVNAEIEESVEYTAENMASDLDAIVKGWQTTADKAKEANKKAAEETGAAWAETTDQMAKAFGEAFASILKDGFNFCNVLKALMQGAINAIATLVGKILTKTFSDFFAKLATQAGGAFSGFSASANTAALGIAAAFTGLWLGIAAGMIQSKKEWDAYWDDVEAKARLAGEVILETIERAQLQAPITPPSLIGTPILPGLIDPTEWQETFRTIENAIRGVEIASEDLEDAWSRLLDEAKRLGKEGSKELVDLIRNFREAGKDSKALSEYVLSWLDTIPDALSTLIRGVDILKGSLVDAAGKLKTGKDLLAALDWRKLHLEEVEERLGELGRIAITTFNSMLASGKSWIDTVEAMAEPLALLRAKYKELGLSFVGTGLGHLFRIVGITEKYKDLFEQIDATKQILTALGNTAWLTSDAWKTLTGDIVGQFHALRHGGLSVEDSLRALVPSLQEIVNYAAAYGFELDAQTQSLIRQAMAHGWIKEAQKTEANILVEGFNRVCDILIKIAEVLGADVSDLMQDISTTAGTFYKTSDDTVTAWKLIGGVLVPFNESLEDAIALAKKLGITVSEIGHDMTPHIDMMPFVTTTGGGTSSFGVSKYQEGGIAWTRQLAEVAELEPEVIKPLREYREEQRPSVTFNINAIDRRGVEEFLRHDAKPILQRMLDRKELDVPLESVGG